jgi:hypothetical protein
MEFIPIPFFTTYLQNNASQNEVELPVGVLHIPFRDQKENMIRYLQPPNHASQGAPKSIPIFSIKLNHYATRSSLILRARITEDRKGTLQSIVSWIQL